MKIKTNVRLIPALLIMLLYTGTGYPNPVSVPVKHPVYEFIERMETMGFITRILDGIKPYSRDKVAGILTEISGRREDLTRTDRHKLDRYLADFRYELRPGESYHRTPEGKNWYSIFGGWNNLETDFRRFFRRLHPEEENHVFIWEKDQDAFYFDYEQGTTLDIRSDDLYRSANWQSYKIRGVLKRNFGYAVDVSLQGIRGDQGYRENDPILKETFNQVNATDENMLYSDRTGGELTWHSDYVDFSFAQQEIEWGIGETGTMILSDYPEQYPYIAVSKDWGWGRFTALHGKLQSFLQDTLTDGTPLYPDKWVAAHRLEIAPLKNLTFGFNEVFIYGNRYADWAYLIPFNFYRAVQHKLRDRDNATISIDAEWIVRPGLKFYGTVFLDEFKRSKLGTDWFGNKHGFQFGVVKTDPFAIPDTRCGFEYVAIMPWVYTHKFDINRYESDGRSLGHWAGPNSEIYHFHIQKDWTYRLRSGLHLRQWKHGANYPNENIGGDLLIGRGVLLGTQTVPRETRRFLEGILTRERRIEGFLDYELFNGFFLSGQAAYQMTDVDKQEDIFTELHFGVRLEY